MPHVEQPQFIPVSEFPASTTWAQKIDFVIGFLRRRHLTILIFLVSAVLLGALYLLVTPSTYTASATMMIDARNTQILPQSAGGGVAGQVDSAWIDSQIGILKSQNVAAYLVKQLRLAEDPTFIGSAGPIDKLLARLGWQASQPKSEAERAGDAIGAVMGGLDVRRAGQTYMININFSSRNPEQASKIANAMIDAYIYDQLNAKFQANRSASSWLQERLEALRGQAADAERAVIEFKAKNNMVAVSGTLMNEKQLGEMSGQLASARSHAADLKAKLDRIDTIRQAYQQVQPNSPVEESISDELTNAIITRLRSQYLDLVNREADYSVRYGKNHTAVVNMRNQMRDLRRSIGDELGRIGESYKSDYEIAKKRQEEAEKGLTGLISQSQATNQAEVALFALQSAAQSYRKIYESFLQQYTQSVQQQSFPITEARPVSQASVSKTSPQTLRIWMLAIFAGGMFGVGFGVLREIMDRGFRTREQVRSHLHTECLAMVPRLTASSTTILPGWQSMIVQPTRKAGSAIVNALRVEPKRVRSALQNNLWAGIRAPSSLYAEALRSIKLGIDLREETSNVIGLTSCFPGEGKSTIAAGVAALIAEGGTNVILVDCDLRNPSLSRAITPHAGAGFLEVVSGSATLAQAVRSDPTTNLHFLPAVRRNQVAGLPNAMEALASDAARSLLATLKAKYDLVIVDLAPLIAGSDNQAASRFVDSYILILEWGSTKVDAVQYALRNAPAVRDRIVGAVLNKVDLATVSRYDNYGALYYYARSGRADLVG